MARPVSLNILCRAQAANARLVQSKTEILSSDAQPVIVRIAVRDASPIAEEIQGLPQQVSGTTALLFFIGLADDPREVGTQMQKLMKHLPSAPRGEAVVHF